MKEDDIVRIIEDRLRRVYQQDIPPGAIKQRHIEAWIVFSGLEADLPAGSTTVKAYFATDTDKLYLWDGTAWVSATFS